MNDVTQISFYQLLIAYIFVILLLLIVRVRGIAREKEILISSLRMTIQLILTGYILIYLFENPSPYLTLLVFLLMQTFAIYNTIKKAKRRLSPSLKRAIAFSMLIGTTSCLLIFLFLVIQITPWFNPQYFIPLAGMLIGNSMTGISLGVNGLTTGMQTQRDLVEGSLMLGATPQMASKEIVNQTFDSAILPTIQSMIGMGIVFLPGMMTGQILSGTSPLTAIQYQIAIMLGILGSVSLSVILFLQLGYQSFFNKQQQLISEDQTDPHS